MITVQNYFNRVDNSILTKNEAAQKGHEFMLKYKPHLETLYSKNDAIRKAIDNQLKIVNTLSSEQKPVKETKTPVTEKKEVAPVKKKNASEKKQPGANSKNVKARAPKKKVKAAAKTTKKIRSTSKKVGGSVAAKKKITGDKKPQPAVTVKRFSKELQLLKSVVALHGKEKSKKSIQLLNNRFANAIKAGHVIDHKSAIEESKKRLGQFLEKMGDASLAKVNIDSDFLSKIKGHIGSATERMRVSYLAGVESKKKTYRQTIKPVLVLSGVDKDVSFEVPEVKVSMLKSTSKKFEGNLSSSSDVAAFFRKTFKRGDLSKQEMFVVLFLNHSNKVIGYYKHSIGGISSTIADPRVVFGAAVKALATGMILCHNHPSGNLNPSDADIRLTKKFKEVGAIHDIAVLDHVIITETSYKSLADEGLMGFKKKMPSLNGFITADKADQVQAPETFRLKGEIGEFMGDLQKYMLAIKLEGESHSGKTQVAYQLADALIDLGYTVGACDFEQGGLESKDTRATIDRNVKPENKKFLAVNGKVPEGDRLAKIKEFADKFDVILLDSWQSLKEVTTQRFNELREEFPRTIFIVIFQKNAKGDTKGGASSQFDAPVAIDCFKFDQDFPKFNYAKLTKNRGNLIGKYFNIVQKKTYEGGPLVPTENIVEN